MHSNSSSNKSNSGRSKQRMQKQAVDVGTAAVVEPVSSRWLNVAYVSS
jgi:hypothetical protein